MVDTAIAFVVGVSLLHLLDACQQALLVELQLLLELVQHVDERVAERAETLGDEPLARNTPRSSWGLLTRPDPHTQHAQTIVKNVSYPTRPDTLTDVLPRPSAMNLSASLAANSDTGTSRRHTSSPNTTYSL